MFKYREHVLSYCLNCKQDSESINRKKMFLSKCAVCNTKKSRFIEEQEVGY